MTPKRLPLTDEQVAVATLAQLFANELTLIENATLSKVTERPSQLIDVKKILTQNQTSLTSPPTQSTPGAAIDSLTATKSVTDNIDLKTKIAPFNSMNGTVQIKLDTTEHDLLMRITTALEDIVKILQQQKNVSTG